MIYSDQFYDAIKEALKKTLDPNLFELCVCELLKKDFPGIVPIQGGKDAGMDGAIPDAKGEPYQLICTTSKSVARNLSSSIKSYINAGRPRNKAVFATSKFLRQKERLSGIFHKYDNVYNLEKYYDLWHDGNRGGCPCQEIVHIT